MLYRVLIKQKTEVIGKVTANTLFGAFLTAYSSLYDIDNDMINDITLSDLFAENVLPTGVQNNCTTYSKNLHENEIGINRTLIARDNSDNNVITNVFGHRYDMNEFYISSELLDIKELEKVIILMLEFGIGKWRNVGKGQYEFISIDEYIPKTDKVNFVALSNFIPDETLNESEITSIGYTIRDAVATNGLKQTTTAMLLTGTSFKTMKQLVGKHVYDKISNTYIHGKAIVIGV